MRSTGEKKWMPMKFFGRFEAFGETGDRQRRGVGAEHGVLAEILASAFFVTFAFSSSFSNTASTTRSAPLISE
jgi:hypothetical protein